jgi:aminopeptidase N
VIVASRRCARLAATLVVIVVLAGSSPGSAQPDERGFDVLGYSATIEPDISAKTITGTVRVELKMLAAAGRDSIELNRGELTIDSVREDGTPLPFEQPARLLRVRLPHAKAGQTRAIDVAYHGAPRNGLVFVPERTQVYTIFSTSQWLVCVDAPDDKATLQLQVILPAGLRAVGSGRFVGARPQPNGSVVHEWREDRPAPSYTFGFAAGKFEEATATQRGVALRYLGEQLSPAELARAFRDTPDMLAFFEERAGVPYPGSGYTQVLVANTIGQEAGGFALLSDAYGRALADNPEAAGLSAHEIAHQWWGNGVTCREWTHFWLNEGFATFMAAAYKEHRFGHAAYLRDIESARDRYEQVRQAGGDRSLMFPEWTRPSANDRTLVYQKGAYVLHQLRETLGERAFWRGIRDYTRRYFGASVTTIDFQRAMEASTKQDLSAFFAKWVYLTEPR